MIKTTGAEFSRFYSDPSMWPEGAWHEEEVEKIADAAKVTIEGGIVFKNDQAPDGPTMESHFRAWRKRQNTATLSVSVDKAKEAQLRELLKEFGAKVS